MYKMEKRIFTLGKSHVWGPALEVMILRQAVSDLGAVPASGTGARTKDLLSWCWELQFAPFPFLLCLISLYTPPVGPYRVE